VIPVSLFPAPLTHPTTLRWSTSLRLWRKEVKNKKYFSPSFPRSGREGGRAKQRPGESTERVKVSRWGLQRMPSATKRGNSQQNIIKIRNRTSEMA